MKRRPSRLPAATLSEAELALLKRVAAEHGPDWKATLRKAWWNGDYKGLCGSNEAWLLKGLRNRLGPVWLTAFKFS